MPPHDLVLRMFNYNSDTGALTWAENGGKTRVGGNRYENRPVGCKAKNGYLKFAWQGRDYLVHRVAWYYVHGELPVCIDHINRVRDDNRIANLRGADYQANQYNTSVSPRNKSGVKGVHRCKQTQKWAATITVNRKQIRLGRYPTIKEATVAREAAVRRYYPEQFYIAE